MAARPAPAGFSALHRRPSAHLARDTAILDPTVAEPGAEQRGEGCRPQDRDGGTEDQADPVIGAAVQPQRGRVHENAEAERDPADSAVKPRARRTRTHHADQYVFGPASRQPRAGFVSRLPLGCPQFGSGPGRLSVGWSRFEHMSGCSGSAVAALAAAVDGLLDVPFDLLAEGDLLPTLEALEVERRRLEAVDQRLLAAAGLGRPGLVDALVTQLRLDRREARERVARSVDLGPRRALSGEELPPLLPVAAKAVQVGEMSAAQTDVLLKTVDDLPPTAPAEAVQVVERVLVDAARFENPRLLARTGRYLLARLDPDGPEPGDDPAEKNRGFALFMRSDGTGTARWNLTADAVALVETVFDALAAPQSTAEQPDTRTAGQRRSRRPDRGTVAGAALGHPPLRRWRAGDDPGHDHDRRTDRRRPAVPRRPGWPPLAHGQTIPVVLAAAPGLRSQHRAGRVRRRRRRARPRPLRAVRHPGPTPGAGREGRRLRLPRLRTPPGLDRGTSRRRRGSRAA